MVASSQMHEVNVLPLVKAYPNLSRKYGEVSCIAGLNLDNGEWIRLYPVPFRSLEDKQKFRKYEPIRARVQRRNADHRPESWRVDADSIERTAPVVSTARGWEARRPIVEPAIGGSMCAIRRAQQETKTSLGMFRVHDVSDLVIEEVERDPEKSEMAEAWAAQGSLLDAGELQQQRKALEQIPFRFQYRYRCSDGGCQGHLQSIVDWEIVELFRNVRDRTNWRELIRKKWLDQMCGADRDTAFIVGNQHQYPDGFLVLGVWWPPKTQQLSLADAIDL
ncbi:MAG TPA: hypothetical protein VFP23_02950 [Solirubrobacterales bacterium]|nr:hypothetical protein [Solirubrobacterales bacterium]